MSKSILVIDDEPGIRTMIQFELSERGFKVSVAESGPQALSILKEKSVDLIITDMRMPVMDGLDTVIAIRESNKNIPIVLMTGYVEERVQKVMEYKIASFLQKPFSLEELMEVVETSLPSSA